MMQFYNPLKTSQNHVLWRGKWVHQLKIFLSFEWRTQMILKILREMWNFHKVSQDYWHGNSRKFTKFKTITHFMRQVSFYTSWKHQKTRGFLIFSGNIERLVEWNGSKASITLWMPIPANISLLKVTIKTLEKDVKYAQILQYKHQNNFFLHPLETPENRWFSDVFKGYRKKSLWCFHC